jgi:hypothetical protein
MSYDRNDYTDTSCPDAPVPPHLTFSRCEHCKEAYVKQSRHELRDWCKVRLRQLNDSVYYEGQRLKAEEEKRLAQEAKEKVRRETPGTWEHQKVIQEEVNKRAREADARGTTSETWPPPRSPSGILLCLSTEILQFITIVV